MRFLLLIGLILLVCCHSGHRDDSKYGPALTFKTGFPLPTSLSGVFHGKDKSSEYVYFADAVTNKKLLLFSPSGTLVDSVPLSQALDSLGQIGSLTIISLDSIVLVSEYSNRIAFLDHRGSCRSVIHLSDELLLADGLRYEIWHSLMSPFMIGNKACFEVDLVGTSVDHYSDARFAANDELYKYYWLADIGPHIASIDLGKGEGRLRWGPEAISRDTIGPVLVSSEIGSFACLNNKWLVFSMYSDTIRSVDPSTMNQIQEFTIHSGFSETHLRPIAIQKGQTINMQDSVNAREASGGCIQSIHFDYPSGHYFVSLLHRMQPSNSGSERNVPRHYSKLEYDGTFRFLRETVWMDEKHIVPFMLCLSSGSFVLRRESKQEQMRGVYVFDQLVLNAN